MPLPARLARAVMDCGLQRISNLEPVSHSLVKLCLCDQVGCARARLASLPPLPPPLCNAFEGFPTHTGPLASATAVTGAPGRIAVAPGLARALIRRGGLFR